MVSPIRPYTLLQTIFSIDYFQIWLILLVNSYILQISIISIIISIISIISTISYEIDMFYFRIIYPIPNYLKLWLVPVTEHPFVSGLEFISMWSPIDHIILDSVGLV